MADSYQVTFNNETDSTWTLALYQTLANAVGLDSVSWLQTTVAPSGSNTLSWSSAHDAAIADYSDEAGAAVYRATQTLSAEPGTAWQIIFADGVSQLEADGSALTPTEIMISNESGKLANPGLGMSGAGALYKRDLLSGATARFETQTTLWAGLFDQIAEGEVIATDVEAFNSTVMVGPRQLEFPSGCYQAAIVAAVEGSAITLSVAYCASSAADPAPKRLAS